MRTRKEIEKQMFEEAKENGSLHKELFGHSAIQIELLLDIRDLLQTPQEFRELPKLQTKEE